MIRWMSVLLILCGVFLTPTAALAEAPAVPPAELAAAPEAPGPEAPAAPGAPAPAQQVPIVVKLAEGTVEARLAVGQPWVAVQVGQQLAEGADLRTGFRARCVLDMVDSLVQIEPLSVVRIGELQRRGDAIRTRLYLKQGNTQSIIEKEQIESDFTIVTPSVTLSVQGTWDVLAGHSQDTQSTFGLTNNGTLGVQNGLGQNSNILPGQTGNSQFLNPIFLQGFNALPNVGDQFGFTQNELFGMAQGGMGFPAPPGFFGPGGPPNLVGSGGFTGSGFVPPPPPPPCPPVVPSNGSVDGGGDGDGLGY